MTISNQPTSLLDSILAAQTTRQDIDVTLLKKAEDTATQQGEAMIKMLEQSAPPTNSATLDVYA